MNNKLFMLLFFLMLNPQDQPIRMGKTGKVHGAGKGLLPPDLSAFGLKVLFPMSSVVISVVSNRDLLILLLGKNIAYVYDVITQT